MNDPPLPSGYYADEHDPGLWVLYRSDGSPVAYFTCQRDLLRYAGELRTINAELGDGGRSRHPDGP